MPLAVGVVGTSTSFQFGGSSPSRFLTNQSLRLRVLNAPPAPWFAPGTTTSSNVLFALISALTTCIVDDGSTLVSSSGTTSISLPLSLDALSTFDEAA